MAVALAWLARGSPESPAAARAAVAAVEAFCADTGYPRTRFDAGALAAAELLRRVGHGDIAEMGSLLAQAVPPVAPAGLLGPGPELTGRVVSTRWPGGRPPEELLGPAGDRPEAGSGTAQSRTCQRCGKPLKSDGSRGVVGRPSSAAGPAGPLRIAHCTGHHRRPQFVDAGHSTPNGPSACRANPRGVSANAVPYLIR